MSSILLAASAIIFILLISRSESVSNKIVCYYGSWATYRDGNSKLAVSDIDANLCTHIIYSFAGITDHGNVILLDNHADTFLKGYEQLVKLKDKNPNLKIMVALGGGAQPSTLFSEVVAKSETRENMVKSIVDFIQEYNLDGCDIDWEYPAQNGGIPEDKDNFVKLIQELRSAFTMLNFTLSAAVGAGQYLIESSYDIPVLSENLDFINLMAYDVHGTWENYTGLNAPLYPRSNEVETGLSVTQFVTNWLQYVGNSDKIILGLGFYGRSFTLTDPQNHEVGSPSSGEGLGGPCTKDPGTLAYFEICNFIKNEGWISVWDDVQKAPYAYKNNQWVGYDNLTSIQLKIDYAKENNLGGLMVWSIDQDDHHNICGDGTWPLLKLVKQNMA